ncbi:MAG: thioredoxin family protein [Gammaproteobacteria bacterium]|nr:thioredoxin family protein [Gammaproteobacteria bacterium]
MELLVYAVLGLGATWILYIGYMNVATRAAEGRSAAPLSAVFPEIGKVGKALVYCYSPMCGPCRPMSREVDSLIDDGAPVYKLDISEHPETSRELGIRATPTLVLVENGSIARMVLGVKMAEFMRDLLGDQRTAS